MKAELILVDDDEVIVEKTWFDKVNRNLAMLTALKAAGVDNWEGYDEAIKIFYKDNPQYDEEF